MAEDQGIQAAVNDETASRGLRVRRVGVVTSDARDKTIRVQYSFSTRHPKYGKTVKRTKNYHAHDEKNEAKLGDTVEIVECRPVSKSKSWRLARILRKSQGGAA